MVVKVKKNKDHYVIVDEFDGTQYPGIYIDTKTAQVAANKMEERFRIENKESKETRGRKKD